MGRTLYTINSDIKMLKGKIQDINRYLEVYKEMSNLRTTRMSQLEEQMKDLKKKLKALNSEYKERIKYLGVKMFTRRSFVYSNGEGGTDIWAFTKDTEEKSIKSYLEDLGIEIDGESIDSIFDCTGRRFTYPVYIEHGLKSIIACQTWGLDV
jgi:hypothetical protein